MSDDIEVDFNEVDLEQEETANYLNGQTETRPQYGRDGWQDYVLGQLREDERVVVKDTIYPKCAGLRRLAELLLGDIVYMGPTKVFPPTSEGGFGRTTVMVEVHIVWTRAGQMVITDLDTACELRPRVFSDAVDVWIGNTPEPYINHSTATATTKALGRALKNALGLNVHTAEEMVSNPKYSSEKDDDKQIDDLVKESVSQPLSSSQAGFIKTLCKQLDIDVEKLVDKNFPGKKFESDTPSKMIDKTEASDLIKVLQGYKTAEGDAVPSDIKL